MQRVYTKVVFTASWQQLKRQQSLHPKKLPNLSSHITFHLYFPSSFFIFIFPYVFLIISFLQLRVMSHSLINIHNILSILSSLYLLILLYSIYVLFFSFFSTITAVTVFISLQHFLCSCGSRRVYCNDSCCLKRQDAVITSKTNYDEEGKRSHPMLNPILSRSALPIPTPSSTPSQPVLPSSKRKSNNKKRHIKRDLLRQIKT